MSTKLALAAYGFTQAIRRVVLTTGFGWICECKHTPTCGEYTIKSINQEGPTVGLYKGLRRTLACW